MPTVRSCTFKNDNPVGNTITVPIPVGTEEDDVVYIFVMSNSTGDRTFVDSSGTWTKLKDIFINGSTNDVNLGLFKKIMGATPDTSITITITGSSQLAAIVVVLEDVDLDNPEDVAITEAVAAGATDPDCPPITPITDGCLIIAFAAATDTDAITNAPAGYSGLVDFQMAPDVNLMVSFKELATAAVEDPAPYADITSSSVQSWAALTIAVRPAPVAVPSPRGFGLLGVMRGAPLITPPPQTFLLLDEFRYGDISHLGFLDFLVIYQSAMVAPGDQDTDPPDPAYLDDFFAALKDDNPTIERICLDYEAWPLVTNNNTANGINLTVVGYYVTLLNAAKPYFSNVGLYGEIPERYVGFLTGSPAENVTRKQNWQSRSLMCQPMWDLVNSVYASLYFINGVYNNIANWTTWSADNLALANARAPGAEKIPFLWPRIHNSVDPNMPDIGGAYWGQCLQAVLSQGHKGFAGWAMAGDTDPRIRNPVPDFWPVTEAFALSVN